MFTEEKNEFCRDYMNIGGIFICTHCSVERFILYMLRQTVEITVATETVHFLNKSLFLNRTNRNLK